MCVHFWIISMASLDGLFSNQEALLKPCAKQHVDMINTFISICLMHPWTFQEVIEITVFLIIFFTYFKGRSVCVVSESCGLCVCVVILWKTHTQIHTALVLEITYIKTKAVGFKLISCLISWHMLELWGAFSLSFPFHTLSCSNLC